jgi:hypothetical protein
MIPDNDEAILILYYMLKSLVGIRSSDNIAMQSRYVTILHQVRPNYSYIFVQLGVNKADTFKSSSILIIKTQRKLFIHKEEA